LAEAASFQLEFKDGSTYDISEIPKMEALRAMKEEHDDGDVQALLARGWTFGPKALLAGQTVENELPPFEVVERIVRDEKISPWRYKCSEQPWTWEDWKDWMVAHGHKAEELFDELKVLFLVLRHSGEYSLKPPKLPAVPQPENTPVSISMTHRPKSESGDVSIERGTTGDTTREVDEGEDFVMVTDDELEDPSASDEKNDVDMDGDHPESTSDGDDDDDDDGDDGLADFMSEDEAPAAPPQMKYLFEDEYKLSTQKQVELFLDDQDVLDRGADEGGVEEVADGSEQSPPPVPETVDLLVLSSGDGGKTWERVDVLKIRTEEEQFREFCSEGGDGAVVRDLRVV
jgi:hypothetical protein